MNPESGYRYETKPSGTNPEDMHEGPVIRRLAVIAYICGTCREEHAAQCYITTEEQTPEQLLDQVAEMLSEPEIAQRILDPYAAIAHEENPQLAIIPQGQTPAGGKGYHKPTEILLTGESEYTCDGCGATFETIGQYRTHQGRNQDTARKIESPSMIPEALLCPALKRREPPV